METKSTQEAAAEEMALEAETRAEQATTQADRDVWMRIASDWWSKA